MGRNKKVVIDDNKPLGTDLVDYTELWNEEAEARNDNPLSLQHPSMSVVAGNTGSGKSSFCMNLILTPEFQMSWDRVHIVSADPDEILFKGLRKKFREAAERARKELELEDDDEIPQQLYEYKSLSELPEVNSLDKTLQHLFILDDCVTAKDQDKAKEYFMRARKRNSSCIYLSQSYFAVPRFIRLQSRYLCMFDSPSKSETTRVCAENKCLRKDQIKKLFHKVKSYPYCPLLIDKSTNVSSNMRFRAGLHPIGDEISDSEEESS